jgi:membrane protein DedA with SNARE-associated domain
MMTLPDMGAIVKQFPYAGLFLLLFLGAFGLPFPEDATLILCGFLIYDDVIAPLPALIIVYFGLLGTDYMLYWAGRRYGNKIVHHKKFRRILSAERLAILEEKFSKNGFLILLLGRHIFGVRAQLFLTAGIVRVAAYKFLLADVISSLFSIVIMVGAGYLGGNSIDIVRKDVSRIEHITVLLALAAVVVYIIIRHMHNKRGSKTR